MAIQKTNHSLLRTISDAVQVQSKTLGIVFSFGIVLLIASFGYKLWLAKKERAAQYDFSALMTEYETMSHENDPEWDSLLTKFEKNYEKHASSSLLPYYLSYKVHILLNQDKKDEALATLDTMIDGMTGSPMVALYEMERALIQLDPTSLATSYEGRGTADDLMKTAGLEALKKLAQDPHNDYRDSAQFYLGRYYWAMNDIDAAREVWQQLVDEQHDEKMSPSPWINHVQDKLALTIV